MILATHALVGAAIGKNVSSPWLVVILSLIIHFILDGFRHGEYFDSRTAKVKDTWWKVALDLYAGLVIIFGYLFSHQLSSSVIFNILLGAFVSMLPDSFTILYWRFRWKLLGKLYDFHQLAHRYSRFPKFGKERRWTLRNAWNDILFSIIAIFFLFF